MRKRFLFWLYLILAFLFACYFLTRIIMVHMGHSQISIIKNYNIHTNSNKQNLNELKLAIGIIPHTNSYSINLEDVNKRILSHPWVKKSAVKRRPNGNLDIKVQFRTAIAQWTDGQYFYPLSADGSHVKTPTDKRIDNTVLFVGDLPNDITEITNIAHKISNKISHLEWIEKRRWNIYTTTGILIKLPEDDFITSLAKIIQLETTDNILSKNISVIDMRDNKRILIK